MGALAPTRLGLFFLNYGTGHFEISGARKPRTENFRIDKIFGLSSIPRILPLVNCRSRSRPVH